MARTVSDLCRSIIIVFDSVERVRRTVEARFAKLKDEDDKKDPVEKDTSTEGSVLPKPSPPSQRLSVFRTNEPFILTHNITRGVMHAIDSGLYFLFMLAIM